METEDLKSVALLSAILVIAVLGAIAFGDEVASRELYDAIRQIESGGNDNAVGDGSVSRGPYQIGSAYWADSGVRWDYHEFVWSRPHCEYVMHLYFKRYGAKTPEEMARCHNSGPKWREKFHLTNEYWNRVKENMR